MQVRITRAETIIEGWHIDELGRVGRGCGVVAVCVVKCDLADETAAPYQKAANRTEENADDEQRRQNGLWCQDRLPGLESLLLESGIYGISSI